MAEITTVTSEALQAEIRRLLPSQQGFGEDLQATNVITPIIDLTNVAEGSALGQNLQTAMAFGSQTSFDVSNTTTIIINTAGFYRVQGNLFSNTNGSISLRDGFVMTDGSSTKNVYMSRVQAGFFASTIIANIDLTVFLRAGDSLIATSSSANTCLSGSFRQIADVNGNLVNPSGFIAT